MATCLRAPYALSSADMATCLRAYQATPSQRQRRPWLAPPRPEPRTGPSCKTCIMRSWTLFDLGASYTQKSDTRNRIPGTSCADCAAQEPFAMYLQRFPGGLPNMDLSVSAPRNQRQETAFL
eukprot:3209370-Rhodomonas_salina.1